MRRGAPWLIAAALLAAPVAALAQTAAPPAANPPPVPAVVIPNFSDPRERIERPATAAVPAIRFLTADDYPPFNFLDDRGQLTGFNVDLARAICTELTIPCTIQARGFDDLLPHLADKSADAVIAGIAITPDTRAEADFSDVYLRLPARFVARKQDASATISADALKGKTVGVVSGTAQAAYLTTLFPGASVLFFPTIDSARAALKGGSIDLLFGDGEQQSFWLQSPAADDCCAFAGGPYLDARYFGEGYAIAIPKGNNALRQAINAALQAVQEKGVFADLYLRYFPIDFF